MKLTTDRMKAKFLLLCCRVPVYGAPQRSVTEMIHADSRPGVKAEMKRFRRLVGDNPTTEEVQNWVV